MLHKKILIPVLALCISSVSGYLHADRLSQKAISIPSAERSLLNSVINVDGRLLAAGEHGVIVFSDDAGESWSQADNSSSTLITGLAFSNKNQGWAVGHDGVLLKSQDTGESWQLVFEGSKLNQLRVSALEQAIANEEDAIVKDELTIQLDDARFALEDNDVLPLLNLAFVDEQMGFAIGAYGMMIQTRDGGENWQYIGHRLPNPEGLHLNRILHLQGETLLLVGESGFASMSRDLGETWQLLESPYDGSFFTAAQTDGVYLFGLRGNGYQLNLNDGQWQKVATNSRATINAATQFDSGNRAVLVGQGGAIWLQNGQGFKLLEQRGGGTFSDVAVIEKTVNENVNKYAIAVGVTGVERFDLSEAQ